MQSIITLQNAENSDCEHSGKDGLYTALGIQKKKTGQKELKDREEEENCGRTWLLHT